MIDWRLFAPRDAVGDVTVEASGVCVFGCRDDQQAILWLLRNTRAGEGPPEGFGELRLRGLAPGNYAVTPWRTASGSAEATQNVSVAPGGELRIRLPCGAADIALAIRPER